MAKLRYKVNPCDIERFTWLAPLGDALAKTYQLVYFKPTNGCPCCMAVRILLTAALSGALGFLLGH